MITAIYPGSFDPITNGHVDVIVRARKLFDRVIVNVADPPTPPRKGTRIKQALFSVEERLEMIREATRELDGVEADHFKGLVVKHARATGARAIIRGLRAISDFEFEFQMALMNRHMEPEAITVFLMPHARYTHLNSSVIREIASFGGDVSDFVPPGVNQRLKVRFGRE